MCNRERLTLHKYRCAKLVAAHPRWRKAVTADCGASVWEYRIIESCYRCEISVLFLTLQKIQQIMSLRSILWRLMEENTTPITFEFSLQEWKVNVVWPLSEVSLGRLSLSVRSSPLLYRNQEEVVLIELCLHGSSDRKDKAISSRDGKDSWIDTTLPDWTSAITLRTTLFVVRCRDV